MRMGEIEGKNRGVVVLIGEKTKVKEMGMAYSNKKKMGV